MEHIRDLIEKYYEGLASPAELAELAERLLDPDVADLFAQRGRLEVNLEAHFKEEGKTEEMTLILRQAGLEFREAPSWIRPRRIWMRWTAVAASVLLVIGLGWWFWLRPEQPPQIVDNNPSRPKIKEEPKTKEAPIAKTVKVVAGTVEIEGRQASAAKNGELVRVVSEKPAVLAMPDGSEAEMEPASKVVMHGEVAGMRQVVELVEGAGAFKVEPGDGLFQVETQVGRVIVLGTEFRVKLLPRSGEKDRIFPGTSIAGLAVVVTSGIVQVDIGCRSHILTAGQDRLFRPEREADKGIRETLATFDSTEPGMITVRKGGDRPKLLTFPLAADARVTIDGKPATLAQLTKGTAVYLQQFPGDGEVIGVRAQGPTVTGELLSLDQTKRTLTLALSRGKEAPTKNESFSWPVDVKVVIHSEPKQTPDLLVGMQLILRLSVDRSQVLEIVSFRRNEKERRP